MAFDVQTRMINDLSAEEVRALLNLEPHATCGFVRITFISNQRIAPSGLPAPFLDGRPAGSALYFMVTPDAPVRLHRIRNGQLYHRYLGDPIEVLMLHENGTSERAIVAHSSGACGNAAGFTSFETSPALRGRFTRENQFNPMSH